MAENRSEILAGAAVLAAAIGFLVYAGQTAGITRDSGSYPLTASFRSAEGISVGTDVRLAGVKVGTVTALALNPQTFFADATISVKQGIELPTDSAILISSEGLLGGNYVELMPGGALENLAPGEEIEDTQGSVSLISLLMKFVGSGAESAIQGEEG
ncbi:outer membrane lipid asymmetry maintenance protein MlaD [Cereibacter azotoformans]|uniref:Phospholipid/cholesterol/gamma-HCH transport system substrate-binding protein n=2 Tax=Cereibacter TaxID=1653176 RepID=A0A2T5KCV5_9RHOB|nr:outer membrane lipid asymmetry maintenance protein MlaD [Cereibacter azotoformans]AXQ93482.1 outer membrane lipid asymmetry maintenance protein MlaD [Cereibacter sphaeroides]MBO4168755.1 outer membrane lipid asymmetry maintenance protein MlaD [Cereibacter azotoformans]PTR20253.1 phospholipid/cholesterol/gamma-HCH transport system substrate-binding protein [Cereibacter azotoformans]UIJ31818.1 outer membrane lipid asymmetry maintenance protein MlaD [Cereibacter azotoformans]ULB09645.1 outer m